MSRAPTHVSKLRLHSGDSAGPLAIVSIGVEDL